MIIVNGEHSLDLATYEPWVDIALDTLCSSEGDPLAILYALIDWASSENEKNLQWFVMAGKRNDTTSYDYSFGSIGSILGAKKCGYDMFVFNYAQPDDENCDDSMQTEAQEIIDAAANQETSNHDVIQRIVADENSSQVEHILAVAYDPDYTYSDSLFRNCTVENRR